MDVATHPDELEFWIPEPEKFDAASGGISWRESVFRPREPFRADAGREYIVPSSLGRPGYLLDWFALLSQGAPAERVGRVLGLAKEWGSPLTLCGVCGSRHVWRGGTSWQSRKRRPSLLLPPGVRRGEEGSHLGDGGTRLVYVGAESVDEWLTWADVLNAIRRVAIANRGGRQGEPADVERFWPVPMQPDDPHPDGDGSNEPEMPPGYRPASERTASVKQAIAGADHRQLVAAFVNKWLSATCVSPTLAYSAEAGPGVPPMRVVRVGSILAWLGWVLREELTAESGDVRACTEPRCGLTFHLIRACSNTPLRRSRELCTLHDVRRRKREQRANRPMPRPEPWKVESERSLNELAELGVEPDQSGRIPPIDRAHMPPAELSALLRDDAKGDEAFMAWAGDDPNRQESPVSREAGRHRPRRGSGRR